MPIIPINSDSILTDIENHFKVSAGPGAGKTHWLVNHIKNVLYNSEKLYRTRKVACITFTNIAVETILRRLGTSAGQVDISTIHSFLYKHIIKPYAAFIAEEYGLNIAEIDGHDDIVLSNYGFLNEWKGRTGQQRIREDNKVVEAFKSLRWKFEDEELIVRPKYPVKVGGYAIRTNSYSEYKRMTWEKGLIHHDDVLFFSYQIIKKFPFVAKVLAAKFPYIFIDEFQDSNPIQVEIFKILGLENITIGIIGDVAQSIYGFQGADFTQFQSFNLSNYKEYTMVENRRSCNEIIDLLNTVRTDIQQAKIRNVSILKPIIYVGDMTAALREAKALCNTEHTHTLSRQNITSNAMKAEINGAGLNSKLLEQLLEIDKPGSGNRYRSKKITAFIKSIAYAKENKFKDAIRELEKLFNYKADKLKGKQRALNFISSFLEKYDEYKDSTLIEFAQFIRENLVPDLANFRTGPIKDFYDGHTFNQLLLCVSIPEDISFHKTIHKAKGDEFKNVLLVLKEENDIKFLTETDLLADEEHRINYVAISRARNRLFISVPSLGDNEENILQSQFDIVTLQ